MQRMLQQIDGTDNDHQRQMNSGGITDIDVGALS